MIRLNERLRRIGASIDGRLPHWAPQQAAACRRPAKPRRRAGNAIEDVRIRSRRAGLAQR